MRFMHTRAALGEKSLDDATYLMRVGQLENWGRWAQSRIRLGSNRCGSIEKHYVAPRDPEATKLDKLIHRTNLNVAEAEQFERAICLVGSSDHRWLVIVRFAHRWPHPKIGRLLGWRGLDFHELVRLVDARLLLAVTAVDTAYEADAAAGRRGSVPSMVLARLRQHVLRMRATTESDAYAFV